MRRASVGGLVAALVSSLVLAGTPVHSASPETQELAAPSAGPQVGVQFHAMWSDYSDAERLEVLDRVAAAGMEWVRIDMGWSSFFETCKTCQADYHVDLADFVVDAANERGLKVLATLWRTPDWANGGAGVYAPPTDPADYGDVAYWAAERFRGRVSAWEVWNEPNLTSFYTGTVRQYVDMLRAAYPRFKEGDPDAQVLLGGPAYNDTEWLERVYEAGAQGFFDVMATHPYMSPGDLPPETPDVDGSNIWLLSHVAEVRSLMDEWGDAGKEIWFTELGWSSHSNWPGIRNWERGVSEMTQAAYAVRTIEFVRGDFPYVTNIFWYNERNRDSGSPQIDNYGLMHRDLRPKPVYEALKAYLVEGVITGGCTIMGTPGNDILAGTEAADVICGREGNDILIGGGGGDVLVGGRGRDTLVGGRGDDTLRGGRGRDALRGGQGGDTLRGGPGHDRMSGGGGRDLLAGWTGDDKLLGGPGRDTLRAGRGRNVARGGLGADRLFLRDGRNNDLGVGGAGWDLCAVDRGDLFRSCPRVRRR